MITNTLQSSFFNLTETPAGVSFTVPRHLRLQFVEALRRQIAWLENQERVGQGGKRSERKQSDNYGLTAMRLRQLASEWDTFQETHDNPSNNGSGAAQALP